MSGIVKSQLMRFNNYVLSALEEKIEVDVYQLKLRKDKTRIRFRSDTDVDRRNCSERLTQETPNGV